MPFTPSHAAAALPLLRTPLPAAALVVGSMAPDLPYFVPGGPGREVTHSPLGGITVDPLIAVLALAAWWLVLRAPVLDLAPRAIAERMPARPDTGLRARPAVGILLVVAAVLIGIATHLAWDWFTHPDGLAEILPAWRTRIGPLDLDHWLQHVSSVAGLLILALWARRWAGRTPRRPGSPFSTPTLRRTAAIALVALWLVLASGVWLSGMLAGRAPLEPSLVFLVARVAFGGLGAAVVLLCGAWWLLRAIHRRTADRRA